MFGYYSRNLINMAKKFLISKIVTYVSGDNTLYVELAFIRARRLKYTHLGKGYPIHTQCLLFSNGILDSSSTIVKHEKDADNEKEAYLIAAKIAIESWTKNKWLQDEVFNNLKKSLHGYI